MTTLGFTEFFNTYDEVQKTKRVEKSPENMFLEAVGVDIPSLSAFTAYLLLDKKIKSTYMENKQRKSILDMPDNRKVLFLVKEVADIKNIAKVFTKNWEK